MIRIAMVIFLATLGTASFAQGSDAYVSGHGALEIFDEQGWLAAPEWVRVWIGIMALSFLAGLFFLKNHIPARWVVGGFIAGFLFSTIGFPALNLVALSGLIALVHLIFWSPGLVKLIQEHAFTGPFNAYAVWSGWITAVILFSFVFDVRDAAIYVMHVLGS